MREQSFKSEKKNQTMSYILLFLLKMHTIRLVLFISQLLLLSCGLKLCLVSSLVSLNLSTNLETKKKKKTIRLKRIKFLFACTTYFKCEYRETLFNSESLAKPRPYTRFSLKSIHWPNFCEVLVNVMRDVTTLFMSAFVPSTDTMR